MTDPNEIAALVAATTNVDYLHHLYLHVADRLAALGRPVPTAPVPWGAQPPAPAAEPELRERREEVTVTRTGRQLAGEFVAAIRRLVAGTGHEEAAGL